MNTIVSYIEEFTLQIDQETIVLLSDIQLDLYLNNHFRIGINHKIDSTLLHYYSEFNI